MFIIGLASFFGQKLYMCSDRWEVKCSEIAAFYDDGTQTL